MDRTIESQELHRALDLHRRHHSPAILTAEKGPLRDYIVGLVRKHVFENEDDPVGKPAGFDVDEDEGLHPRPMNQKVEKGWGINSQTGELIPPEEV